jgi:hypothetical protein
MSKINSLLKKRAALEAKIAEAQRQEKRKSEIVALLEKHGLLDLTDEQILSALKPKSASPQVSNSNMNGATQ